jgi:hypothetical protein
MAYWFTKLFKGASQDEVKPEVATQPESNYQEPALENTSEDVTEPEDVSEVLEEKEEEIDNPLSFQENQEGESSDDLEKTE